MEAETHSFVAECFWPGVEESDLETLERRVRTVVAEPAADGVRYLGAILMREDEVVLCHFEGTAHAVRRAAERAGVPFERLIETTGSMTRFRPSDTRRSSR